MSESGLEAVVNFVPVTGCLGTAGQPRRGQFCAIQDAGYEVVINLAMPDSTGALPDEAEQVTRLGLEYVHIPVVWQSPGTADLERFFEAMDACTGRKVFVHCALNYRVSAFVFLYRTVRLGVPPEEAWNLVRTVWEPDDVWRQFIDASLCRYGLPPLAGPNTRGRDEGTTILGKASRQASASDAVIPLDGDPSG